MTGLPPCPRCGMGVWGPAVLGTVGALTIVDCPLCLTRYYVEEETPPVPRRLSHYRTGWCGPRMSNKEFAYAQAYAETKSE